MKHYKILVRGRVQGVAFRAHTRRMAVSLGLTGFVENRPDGSVYAEIEGPAGQVEEMIGWLHTGPPMAQVESVTREEGRLQNFDSFEVRR